MKTTLLDADPVNELVTTVERFPPGERVRK